MNYEQEPVIYAFELEGDEESHEFDVQTPGRLAQEDLEKIGRLFAVQGFIPSGEYRMAEVVEVAADDLLPELIASRDEAGQWRLQRPSEAGE